MIINYSDEEVKVGADSIFLAGPTPRSKEVTSWRLEALELLKKSNFNGIVYVPESKDGKPKESYIDQTLWEREALMSASIIVFYIPRDLKTMPAFTTNVEFGYYINMKKILYGRPDGSPKNKYLDWLYEYELGKIPHISLESLLEEAVDILRNQKVLTVSKMEFVIEKIIENPSEFYTKIFETLSIQEQAYIRSTLFNKTCENCENKSCPLCGKVLLGSACDVWLNDEITGKSKITGERDVLKLIKK